jgi:UDP-N-acetylglucosamine 4-epimerase
LQKISGKELKANYGPPRAGDVRDSLADISKARRLLDYQPEYSVRQGLKKAWDYFIKHQ